MHRRMLLSGCLALMLAAPAQAATTSATSTAAACVLSAPAPNVIPRFAKAVLHEMRSASARLTWPPGPHGWRSSFASG